MAIRTIEVMCIPCPKCNGIEPQIRQIIKNMEINYKIKIPFEYKSTPNLKEMGKYGLNAAQAPAIIINGKAEIAGRLDQNILKQRLELIHRMG
jgi:hypothetical protein